MFITTPDLNQQIGFVVYGANSRIEPHVHKPIERNTVGTSEVLLVRKGTCEVDVFNEHRVVLATRTLNRGDLIYLAGGGHGFRMLEDTILVEIKQGPYTGLDEKERF